MQDAFFIDLHLLERAQMTASPYPNLRTVRARIGFRNCSRHLIRAYWIGESEGVLRGHLHSDEREAPTFQVPVDHDVYVSGHELIDLTMPSMAPHGSNFSKKNEGASYTSLYPTIHHFRPRMLPVPMPSSRDLTEGQRSPTCKYMSLECYAAAHLQSPDNSSQAKAQKWNV
jgi:hypothetical protein